jgi:hypothetical protein
MSSVDDYLKKLDLNRPVTHKDIKKRYHQLALVYHPDKYNGDHSLFQDISIAYNTLISLEIDAINEGNEVSSSNYNTDYNDFSCIPDNIADILNEIKSNIDTSKFKQVFKTKNIDIRLAINVNELHYKHKPITVPRIDEDGITRNVTFNIDITKETSILIGESDRRPHQFIDSDTWVAGDIIIKIISNGSLSDNVNRLIIESNANTSTSTSNTSAYYLQEITIKELSDLTLFKKKILFPDGSYRNIEINSLFKRLIANGSEILQIAKDSGVPPWFIKQEHVTSVPLKLHFSILYG